MLVSAISFYNSQTVSNLGTKIKDVNAFSEDKPSPSPTIKNDDNKQDDVFEIINEWKNFCHQQIKQGKFDIIV